MRDVLGIYAKVSSSIIIIAVLESAVKLWGPALKRNVLISVI